MIFKFESLSLVASGILAFIIAFRIFPFDADHFGRYVEELQIKWKRMFIISGIVMIAGGVYRIFMN